MFSTSPHVGGIRIPESGKFFLIGKFCSWNPESRALESRIELIQVLQNPTKEWNVESKFHWKRLESRIHGIKRWDRMESRGDSTALRTANYYSFSFIYLPLIRSPHFRKNLKTFVNEISIRRFIFAITDLEVYIKLTFLRFFSGIQRRYKTSRAVTAAVNLVDCSVLCIERNSKRALL